MSDKTDITENFNEEDFNNAIEEIMGINSEEEPLLNNNQINDALDEELGKETINPARKRKKEIINKNLFFDDRYDEKMAIKDAIEENRPGASEIMVRVPGSYYEQDEETGQWDDVGDGYKDGCPYIYKKYLLNDEGNYIQEPTNRKLIEEKNPKILRKLKKVQSFGNDEFIELTSGKQYFVGDKDRELYTLSSCRKGKLVDLYSTNKGSKIAIPRNQEDYTCAKMLSDINPELCLKIEQVVESIAIMSGAKYYSFGYALNDNNGHSYFLANILTLSDGSKIRDALYELDGYKIKGTDQILYSVPAPDFDDRFDLRCYPYKDGYVVTEYRNGRNSPDQYASRRALEISKEGEVIPLPETVSSSFADGTLSHYVPWQVYAQSPNVPEHSWLEKDGHSSSAAHQIMYDEKSKIAILGGKEDWWEQRSDKQNIYILNDSKIAIFTPNNGFDESISFSAEGRCIGGGYGGIVKLNISRQQDGKNPETVQMKLLMEEGPRLDYIVKMPKFKAFLKDLHDNPEKAFLNAQERENESEDLLQFKENLMKKYSNGNLGKTADVKTGKTDDWQARQARKQIEVAQTIMSTPENIMKLKSRKRGGMGD